MTSRIYLDHSATTPIDPRVRAAMEPFHGDVFGNPSSLHGEGRKARQAVETARAQVASLLNADPSEIIFTASGTEADNLALIGAVRSRSGPSHIVTSVIEHAAVLETCNLLGRLGTAITYLRVDGCGLVHPEGLRKALRKETQLVSVMAASNVIGTIQPIEELARITHERGALFHTDAVQAGGKIPLDVRVLPVDLVSLSAHKLHGPKGIGALYVRDGVHLDPIIFGGGQERGLRSATENVAAIAGFGAAAALAREEITAESVRLLKLRERIVVELKRTVPSAHLIGHPVKRLPGHLCLGFLGQESEMLKLVLALDEAGIAVSAGSACDTNHADSKFNVLAEMGFDEDRSRGLLRVTLGRFTKDEEVTAFLKALPRAVASLKPSEESAVFSAAG